MPRKKAHEDHVNHEAWAIPYGDLITLLLAFFVVMYATSSLNEGKFRVLSNSMVAAFGGPPRAVMPIQVGMNKAREDTSMRTIRTLPLDSVQQNLIRRQHVSLPLPLAMQGARGAGGNTELARLAEQLGEALRELEAQGQVRITRYFDRIEIAIGTDVLFPSGSAEVTAQARAILLRIAGLLGAVAHPVVVEGHTDDVPIRNARFPSNWELSAGRAGRVIRLFSDSGIDDARMSLRAFGEQRPEVPNTDAAARNRNRRVLVIVHARARA